MGSIGVFELAIIAAIGLVPLAIAVVVIVVVVKKGNAPKG